MTPYDVQSDSQDDQPIVSSTVDISGGINNRFFSQNVPKNQVTYLYNVDIGVPGDARKRPGLTLIEDLGIDAGTGLFGFDHDGGTAELLATHGTKLEGWTGSGAFTEHKVDFVNGTPVKMIKGGESGEGDVVFVYVS